jgi:hypothetical protein
MPALNGCDSAPTLTQYAHLQRWQAGNYANLTGRPRDVLAGQEAE